MPRKKLKRKLTVCKSDKTKVQEIFKDIGLFYTLDEGLPTRSVADFIYFSDRPKYHHLVQLLDHEKILFSTSYF